MANYQSDAQRAIQPSLDEIASIQALIDSAKDAGLDTTAPKDLSDASAVIAALGGLKSDAESVAAPIETLPSADQVQ